MISISLKKLSKISKSTYSQRNVFSYQETTCRNSRLTEELRKFVEKSLQKFLTLKILEKKIPRKDGTGF